MIGTAAYLFGGVTTTNGTDTAAIQRYDPKTNTTSVVAQLPAPLSHASAITFGNVVFLLGGFVNNTPSTQVLRFDISTNRITNVGALPAPLTDAAATVVAGTGYLVGEKDPAAPPPPTSTLSAPVDQEDRPGAGGCCASPRDSLQQSREVVRRNVCGDATALRRRP